MKSFMNIESISKLGINHPLIIDNSDTNGTGIANPSILNVDGFLYINIRMLNYTLYHSIGAKGWMEEGGRYSSRWGPLTYVHPENDARLVTDNFLAKWSNSTKFNKINMKLDIESKWTFAGLEDGRLVNWNNKVYITGVRRDTTDNGQGRMELSELKKLSSQPTEISRVRIEHPTDPNSYCEKNWMPVRDMPYHFVMDANPTKLVKANPKTGKCKLVYEGEKIDIDGNMRGSSQIIKHNDGFFAIVHDTNWWRFEDRCAENKDAIYSHRLVQWDKDFVVQRVSKQFTFMDGQIEFCCGMDKLGDDFYITFGFEDNSAHMLQINEKVLDNFFDKNLEYSV
jgi:hypothetical protein